MTDPEKPEKEEPQAKGEREADEEEEAKADETKEEGSKKEKDDHPPPEDGSSARPSRSKRARKSAEAFAPENFKDVDRSVTVVQGRGKKLGELEAVKNSVDSFTSTSEDMIMAHKLLYTTKGGKPPRKEMKGNILAFNGFLAQKQEGQDEKEMEAQDDEAEVRSGLCLQYFVLHQRKG